MSVALPSYSRKSSLSVGLELVVIPPIPLLIVIVVPNTLQLDIYL